MKRVIVCYKWVWDDADIRVNEKTRKLDFERARKKISEYDRNAIEVGAELKKQTGCEVIALTGGAEVEPSLKDALSRGPDSAWHVNDPALAEADAHVTARVLAGLIRKIGDADLVVCGEGSSDDYHQQTGSRLAALLGFASVSFVNKIEPIDGGVRLERKLEEGVEVVEVQGPAVVSVLPDINDAPIPGLKQILAAKKKPVNRQTLEDIGLDAGSCRPKAVTVSTLSPVIERKRIRMNPEGVSIEQAAAQLAGQLVQDGIWE